VRLRHDSIESRERGFGTQHISLHITHGCKHNKAKTRKRQTSKQANRTTNQPTARNRSQCTKGSCAYDVCVADVWRRRRRRRRRRQVARRARASLAAHRCPARHYKSSSSRRICEKSGRLVGFSFQQLLISRTHDSGQAWFRLGRRPCVPTANTIWNGGIPGA